MPPVMSTMSDAEILELVGSFPNQTNDNYAHLLYDVLRHTQTERSYGYKQPAVSTILVAKDEGTHLPMCMCVCQG